jgi:hypothetical protein
MMSKRTTMPAMRKNFFILDFLLVKKFCLYSDSLCWDVEHVFGE